MRRHCDGTDPNLLRPTEPDGSDSPPDWKVRSDQTYRACDCGKLFDDVNTIVIYPHQRF